MPTDWGPIIGSVVGSAADAWSQNAANKANAANVQKQIDFQKQQGETAYQRAVEDLKKAGLNPGLAYQQGGASSGAGAAANNQPITQNSVAKFATAVDAYNGLATGSAQRNLIGAQADATRAQEENTRATTIAMFPSRILGEDPEYQRSFRETALAELGGRKFSATKTPERFAADIANTGAGTARAQAQAVESRNRSTLLEQQFQTEWFRKHMAPFINNAKTTMGAAGDAAKLITAGRRNVFDFTGR